MFEEKTVSTEDLLLDPNNYRIRNDSGYMSVAESEYGNADIQLRTLSIVCGAKDVNVEDLKDSFINNGYLPIDQIQVVKYGDTDKFLVVEGNRRVAALKKLEKGYRESGLHLGRLSPTIFENVPVVVSSVNGPADAMILMGLKHISGNKKWSDYNQAMYIYDLYAKEGLSKDEICSRIAISKVAVGASLRALALVRQYKESDYGDQFSEQMFGLFREIARSLSLKEWLGWDEANLRATNQEHAEQLFSLISSDMRQGDGEDEEVEVEPAITKRSELRQLTELLGDATAMAYLQRTRNLSAAYARSSAVVADQTRNLVDTLETDVRAVRNYRIDANGVARLNSVREMLNNVISDNESTMGVTDRKDACLVGGDTSSVTMINSISIRNYKGFKDFAINPFSSINVIAGANNTGKTSLLEAIYLLLKQSDVRAIFHLTDKRFKMSSQKEGYEWSSEQISEFNLSGMCRGMHSSVALERGGEHDAPDPDYITTVELSAHWGETSQKSTNRVFAGYIERDPPLSKDVCPVIFTSPFYNNEQANYRRYYLACSENKSIDRIIAFIKDKILSNVERIYWDDNVRRFKVADSRLKLAADLAQYGEGMQRIFLLSLLFASAEGGVLLIDELENAIHPGLLAEFIGLTVELAAEFGVQMFITTHSKECIDAFAELAEKKRPQSFEFIGLVKGEGDARVARMFDGSTYVKARSMADVDLRRVV